MIRCLHVCMPDASMQARWLPVTSGSPPRIFTAGLRMLGWAALGGSARLASLASEGTVEVQIPSLCVAPDAFKAALLASDSPELSHSELRTPDRCKSPHEQARTHQDCACGGPLNSPIPSAATALHNIAQHSTALHSALLQRSWAKLALSSSRLPLSMGMPRRSVEPALAARSPLYSTVTEKQPSHPHASTDNEAAAFAHASLFSTHRQSQHLPRPGTFSNQPNGPRLHSSSLTTNS